MELESAIAPMLQALKSILLGSTPDDPEVERELRALLEEWPTPFAVASAPQPRQLPACSVLEEATDAAERGPARGVAVALRPLLSALSWGYGYADHPTWPDLSSRICFAQIIGPRGVMDDRSVHVGLTLMAPLTLYPLHSHPAVETYLVLSGSADWRVERTPFEPRGPGALIFHRSGIGHAMRTGSDAMLALFFWRGDLETAPVYVEEPAPG